MATPIHYRNTIFRERDFWCNPTGEAVFIVWKVHYLCFVREFVVTVEGCVEKNSNGTHVGIVVPIITIFPESISVVEVGSILYVLRENFHCSNEL